MTSVSTKRAAGWLMTILLVLACGGRATGPTVGTSGTPIVLTSAPIGPSPIDNPSASTRALHSAAPRASGPAAPSQSLDPVFRSMIGTIAAHRPAYRFSFTPDRLEGDWRLDGVADDGQGPGRLFIDLTREAGMLTANPCRDPDFVQRGDCSIQVLATGARLVRRGLVEANGTRTVVVALIQPNRSGITIEASNFSIDGRAVDLSRPLPLYTVDDLAELVLAIDDRVGISEGS